MRVYLVGAGAMGTLFGTTLVKAGHNVTFLDSWQPLVYAISKDSFASLKGEEDTIKIPVHLISTHDAQPDNVDLIIVFVKSSNTLSSMKLLSSNGVITPNTVVLTCQGGFENVGIIASFMKDTSLLLYGCTTSFCKSYGPMSIEKYGIRNTTVWPYRASPNTEPNARVKQIVEECSQAGLMMELTPSAITDRWRMLLTYPTNSAVSAISDLPYGVVWATEEGRKLLTEIAKEVALVAKLEGIDDSLFNEQIAVAAVTDMAQDHPDRVGTLLLDLKAKRTTETDATSGALIRKAEQHGVKLPYLTSIYYLIRLKEENYGNEFESRIY